eukprot:Hpha_TRINITY_DN12648_c0_g1::TRINITY_DN12648_c0_g1_i2::g.49750::m.49750
MTLPERVSEDELLQLLGGEPYRERESSDSPAEYAQRFRENFGKNWRQLAARSPRGRKASPKTALDRSGEEEHPEEQSTDVVQQREVSTELQTQEREEAQTVPQLALQNQKELQDEIDRLAGEVDRLREANTLYRLSLCQERARAGEAAEKAEREKRKADEAVAQLAQERARAGEAAEKAEQEHKALLAKLAKAETSKDRSEGDLSRELRKVEQEFETLVQEKKKADETADREKKRADDAVAQLVLSRTMEKETADDAAREKRRADEAVARLEHLEEESTDLVQQLALVKTELRMQDTHMREQNQIIAERNAALEGELEKARAEIQTLKAECVEAGSHSGGAQFSDEEVARRCSRLLEGESVGDGNEAYEAGAPRVSSSSPLPSGSVRSAPSRPDPGAAAAAAPPVAAEAVPQEAAVPAAQSGGVILSPSRSQPSQGAIRALAGARETKKNSPSRIRHGSRYSYIPNVVTAGCSHSYLGQEMSSLDRRGGTFPLARGVGKKPADDPGTAEAVSGQKRSVPARPPSAGRPNHRRVPKPRREGTPEAAV